MKIHKTNAARRLDQANISYHLIPYVVDENDLSAVHVAERLQINPSHMFKTLVLSGDKIGYFVCVIPGPEELDLKQAARASHNKRAELIPMKDLFTITGYMRGGCSPIAMKKPFPTFIDQAALELDKIYVSAGQRGLQLQMKSTDLIEITRAKVDKLCVSP